MSRRSIMQVAVHTLGSVPSSAFKDSTPATPTNRGSPTPHRVRLLPSFLRFLVLLSRHCVLKPAKLWCSSCCLLSLLCCCTCELWCCFLTKILFALTEGGRSKRRNGDGELTAFIVLQLFFFKLYLYLLQNQKTIPPSQQPIASASVLPTLLCPICILAVGRSCRKSSTATCHS